MGILTINSREARNNFRDLLDRILAGDTDVIIERNGKPVAALIPIDDYKEILDELDDLRAGRRANQAYEAWKKNLSRGVPYKDFRDEMFSDDLLDE